jgi:hypothetical protein
MSKTQSLKTGNAAARKAGRAVSFVVTQESFDVAFHAGRAVAGAFQAAATALQPLLTPLSGLSSPEAVAQWNEYRRGFALGMAAERDIDPDSARRMFGRIVDFLGLSKPQTEAARAKQAKRAAQAPNDDDGEASPMDGAGAVAAQAVQMALSSMEAHLIGMLRAGKYTQAAQAVADMASSA